MQNNGGVGDDEGEEADLAALAVLVARGGVIFMAANGFKWWFLFLSLLLLYFFLCF